MLSDISALTYNYKYEYKKKKQDIGLQLSTDFEISIYLRFDNNTEIDKSLFSSILEEYITSENRYIIGDIKFSSLIASNLISNKNVNIILVENNKGAVSKEFQ